MFLCPFPGADLGLMLGGCFPTGYVKSVIYALLSRIRQDAKLVRRSHFHLPCLYSVLGSSGSTVVSPLISLACFIILYQCDYVHFGDKNAFKLSQ